MNLKEAKQLLNNNGYVIDEGIGNFVKKARRAVFGKNQDDEDILAKRKARLAGNEENRAQRKKAAEHSINYVEEQTNSVLRTIKGFIDKYNNWGEDSEVSRSYNALIELKKKYGKNIGFRFGGYGSEGGWFVVYVYGVKLKDFTDTHPSSVKYGKDKSGNNKYTRGTNGTYTALDFTYDLGSIGLYAGANSNYSGSVGKMKYATNIENNRKMEETTDMQEWVSKINGLMREYIQGVKADDVDEWEANIDQNESVKVKQAVKYLKENGYIVEGHWYDTTTGFRRYREEPDEREARYYNTLVDSFKELKEADEAQDKDHIRQKLETIEIFVRRIGHAISSSDKKGLAKDGLEKMKKYFQDKGQDDLAALVDKYAEEVLKLIW